jgi:hypothetical protein
LLDAGANIYLRSKDILPTALDFAINKNEQSTALLLLLYGADPMSKISDAADAPSSITFASEELKQAMNDAMQAWETFSKLSRINMLSAVSDTQQGSDQSALRRTFPLYLFF